MKDMNRILVIFGPNLDQLGIREPEIYGNATLDDHISAASSAASSHGMEMERCVSNHEGELIEAVHGARGRCQGIIINAGALSHYSWSLHDALASFDGVAIELHLSNPAAREPWRHTSVLAPVVDGMIAGFGIAGYELAFAAMDRLLV